MTEKKINDKRISISDLRSQRWLKPDSIRGFAHRQRLQQIGFSREEFLDKPVIAIINTWSDMSPCHSHLKERSESIKRAIWAAGGFPVELPVNSTGEVFVKPSTMLYRNLLAMETEELLRSLPIDGAVLLGGCDKSTPGMLMGAISMDLPSIFCPAGAMSSGKWRGETTGAGTHTKKYWDKKRLGDISLNDWTDLEGAMTRTPGTCNTMGTASTMTSIADSLGFSIPGASSIPAVDGRHSQMAAACGKRIVEMVWEDLRPSKWLTRKHFDNAIATYISMGGSTNAAIHIIAMARRANIDLTLKDLDQFSKKIPVIANLLPSGKYLMDDFYFAGGLKAQLKKIQDFLHLDCAGVTQETWRHILSETVCYDDDIIRDLNNPVTPLSQGETLAVLYGNLCPDGAVLKSSAAHPKFSTHRGPALVFDDHETLTKMIDDPHLDVTENTVLILRNAGPIGAPGMPEWGNLPIPKKLLAQGVTDMIRISDARMSGTHYGSCILHVAPEAAAGGPLSLVKTGDMIELDIKNRILNMDVTEEELALRRLEFKPKHHVYDRSYAAMYQAHVNQANDGCDFDFLKSGAATPEPPIY